MTILTISRNETPNVSSVRIDYEAHAAIEEHVKAFREGGGEIQQIPTGQSAYNLQAKSVKDRSRGTRVTWEDQNLHMASEQSRRMSINLDRQKKAVKGGKAGARAASEKGRSRREEVMPKVRKMLEEGKSRRDIALHFGVSHGTVNYWIKQDGV